MSEQTRKVVQKLEYSELLPCGCVLGVQVLSLDIQDTDKLYLLMEQNLATKRQHKHECGVKHAS